MTVSLSSLRVVGDFDASGYARGAAQKVSADQAMIAADKARNASLAQADAALRAVVPGMVTVSKALLDGYGAGTKFEQSIRQIGNAVDRGMGLDRAGILLDAAYKKFGLTADAAVLVERGFVSIAPAVDRATRAYDAHVESMTRVAAQSERVAAAQRAQAAINGQFGIGVNDNSASRAADVMAYGSALDQLRAKYVPLFAAGQQYKLTLDEINMAARVGAISENERASAVAKTKTSFADQVGALRGVKAATVEATAATGLQRYELINLSRQFQDVVVSLQGGQGFGTVMLQQGSQIADVFTSSKSTVGDFARQSANWLGNFLTVGRVAFGGVALAATGAGLAMNSFLDKQQKVALALTGAGRASGATTFGINSVAQSSASLTGFSISESRAFAVELASTGKIGRDNLAPLVAIGHDIATAFGVDAADAAKLLGKSFSDPAAGAAQLNDRLGFLDAAMQRQILNLSAQNRLQDAQRVLLAGTKSGLDGVADSVGTTTKFWTALGNVASNTWDRIGEAASRATGIGLKIGLDEQIDTARKRLASFQKDLETARAYETSLGSAAKFIDTGFDAATAGVKKYGDELERLTGVTNRNTAAAEAAQQRQRSLAQDAAVRSVLPDVGALEAFRNQAVLLEGAIADTKKEIANLVPDEAMGGRLKTLTDALNLFNQALGVTKANATDFKTTFQAQSDSLKLAGAAITAFSPRAKADIARQQSLDGTARSGFDGDQRKAIAEQAYGNALKQATTAMSEQQRARELSANQAIASSQLEIQLLGKTIGQQAELRANLQARQALEQEASTNHTQFDEARYQRLAKINALLGEQAQLAAKAAVQDQIKFGAATSMLSPDDVAIAQQLKGLYPDVATALASVQAAGLRTNAALSGISSTMSGTLTTGLTDIADGTKSISAGAGDMSKAFIRAIEEMIIKIAVVTPLMRALQIAAGSLGGGLMGGGSPSGYGGASANANGNAFDGSNVVPFARGGAFTNDIFTSPTFFKFANGGAMANGVMGEAGPEAVMPLRRGSDGRLGVAMSGSGGGAGGNGGGVNVNVFNAPAGTNAHVDQRQNADGSTSIDITLKKMVEGIVSESVASGDVGRTISSKFGVKSFAGS